MTAAGEFQTGGTGGIWKFDGEKWTRRRAMEIWPMMIGVNG